MSLDTKYLAIKMPNSNNQEIDMWIDIKDIKSINKINQNFNIGGVITSLYIVQLDSFAIQTPLPDETLKFYKNNS